MAFDPTQLRGINGIQDITTNLAAGALTITTAVVWKVGSDTTFRFTYSDSSVGYIKMGKNGRVKVGGATPQFDSGTEVVWAF
jgi:hypothetical protein